MTVPTPRSAQPCGDAPDWHAARPADCTQATMAQLLTLAGPGLADALLAQFHADLSSVCARMTGALAAGDRVQLASALHVLLALADTAGAHPLAQDARTLHTKADIMPQITLAQSGAVVLDGLARLIEQINRIAADRLTCA